MIRKLDGFVCHLLTRSSDREVIKAKEGEEGGERTSTHRRTRAYVVLLSAREHAREGQLLLLQYYYFGGEQRASSDVTRGCAVHYTSHNREKKLL